MMLIDGQEGELISAGDRGLHYGDGLFETIAVRDGRPSLWTEHMLRLHEGCLRLGIPMPVEETLLAEALRVCAGAARAVLKIIITRGSAGRGYRPAVDAMPRRIIALYPWPDYPLGWWEDGVEVRLCDTRLGSNARLAGIKHLNRLEQVLARAEWTEPDIAEGLMLDREQQVIEGTMTNLFLVHDGWLLTPALDECGVAGVMRARVLMLAEQLGIGCEITRLHLSDIYRAQEAFLCNSVVGIWPIHRFQEHQIKVGDVTRRLMQALAVSEGVAGA